MSSSAVIENSDIVSILSAPLSSPISFQKISFSESIPEYDGFYAVILDDVLSQAECEALVHAAEASTANGEWEVALVNVGGNQHLLRTDIRDCERIVWDDKTLVAAIFERVRPFVTELEKLENWPSVTGKESATKGEIWKLTRRGWLNERMQYLKYSSGQYFRKHCDGVYETRSRDERSHFTLQIYLNDSASQAGNEALEGGSTRFHSMLEENLNLDVEPKTGRVLIFQHDLLHSGEEVFRGFKMTMRTDLMYKRA